MIPVRMPVPKREQKTHVHVPRRVGQPPSFQQTQEFPVKAGNCRDQARIDTNDQCDRSAGDPRDNVSGAHHNSTRSKRDVVPEAVRTYGISLRRLVRSPGGVSGWHSHGLTFELQNNSNWWQDQRSSSLGIFCWRSWPVESWFGGPSYVIQAIARIAFPFPSTSRLIDVQGSDIAQRWPGFRDLPGNGQ